jgi:hypothetical protein
VIIALFILEAYPVFSPVQLVDDKNILSSDQRMKGVDNTKSLSLIYCIRCSRYLMRNKKVSIWRVERNNRMHRSTEKAPSEALKEERLKGLPAIPYLPQRTISATISTTGFIEFETNRYSVPAEYADMGCEVVVYPEQLEIRVKGRRIATHKRSFEKKQKIEHPSHREKLLTVTPQFKQKRIYQLMKNMDRSIEKFIASAETGKL